MSVSFSAEQYDQEFAAKRMQMYEVPRQQLSKNPSAHAGATNFIADNKGHLLEGTKKGESNPFGDFVGTWDLPKSIPGPYFLNPTSRTNKNVVDLTEKRDKTEDAIRRAANGQKPVNLRAEPQEEPEKPYKVNEALNYVGGDSYRQDDGRPDVYYNPDEE